MVATGVEGVDDAETVEEAVEDGEEEGVEETVGEKLLLRLSEGEDDPVEV